MLTLKQHYTLETIARESLEDVIPIAKLVTNGGRYWLIATFNQKTKRSFSCKRATVINQYDEIKLIVKSNSRSSDFISAELIDLTTFILIFKENKSDCFQWVDEEEILNWKINVKADLDKVIGEINKELGNTSTKTSPITIKPVKGFRILPNKL